MIKETTYKILSLTMALMILISSTGFYMDMHFCQDNIKGVSFIGKAKSCHSDKTNTLNNELVKKCPHHTKSMSKTEKDDCCHNESIEIDKTDINKIFDQIRNNEVQVEFLIAFVHTYIYNNKIGKETHFYQHYRPPLDTEDFQINFQVFLI